MSNIPVEGRVWEASGIEYKPIGSRCARYLVSSASGSAREDCLLLTRDLGGCAGLSETQAVPDRDEVGGEDVSCNGLGATHSVLGCEEELTEGRDGDRLLADRGIEHEVERFGGESATAALSGSSLGGSTTTSRNKACHAGLLSASQLRLYRGHVDRLFLPLLWILGGISTEMDGGRISVACRLVSATVFRTFTDLAVDLYSPGKDKAFRRVARCLSMLMDPFFAGHLKHRKK